MLLLEKLEVNTIYFYSLFVKTVNDFLKSLLSINKYIKYLLRPGILLGAKKPAL